MLRRILLLCVYFLPLVAFAAIYQQVTPSGGVVYSDTPQESSQVMSLAPPNRYQTTTTTAQNQKTTSVTSTSSNANAFSLVEPSAAYTRFEITNPQDQYTFTNQPVLSFTVAVEPELKEGDRVQLFMDGVPQGPPQASLTFNLENVDRGTHVMSATLIGTNGGVLMTARPITVYVQHVHLNQLPAANRASAQ